MRCSNIPFFERQRVIVNKSKRIFFVNIFYYLFDANFKSHLHLTRQTHQKIINFLGFYFVICKHLGYDNDDELWGILLKVILLKYL